MVERQPSKLAMRVRFPLPAPNKGRSMSAKPAEPELDERTVEQLMEELTRGALGWCVSAIIIDDGKQEREVHRIGGAGANTTFECVDNLRIYLSAKRHSTRVAHDTRYKAAVWRELRKRCLWLAYCILKENGCCIADCSPNPYAASRLRFLSKHHYDTQERAKIKKNQK